jgi:DNA-binding Xre family transcriptional regulator
MIDMRLRVTELMAQRGLATAYQLSKASKGRISMTKAYRLVESAGRPERIELDTLEALCETFNVGPGELLEREKKRKVG